MTAAPSELLCTDLAMCAYGRACPWKRTIPLEAFTPESKGLPRIFDRDHIALKDMNSCWKREVYLPAKSLYASCTFVREMMKSFDHDFETKSLGRVWVVPIAESQLCKVIPDFQMLSNNLHRLRTGEIALTLRSFRHLVRKGDPTRIIHLAQLCEFMGFRDGYLACIAVLEHRIFALSYTNLGYRRKRYFEKRCEWAWRVWGHIEFARDQEEWKRSGRVHPDYLIQAFVQFGDINEDGFFCCMHYRHGEQTFGSYSYLLKFLRNKWVRQLMLVQMLRRKRHEIPEGCKSLGEMIRARLDRKRMYMNGSLIDACVEYLRHILYMMASELENVTDLDLDEDNIVIYKHDELARLLKSNC